MEKFKKIDKEYLLTDNSLNVYDYRLLTEGYQLPEFKKNPIGYRMHLRDEGVVVRWDDFRIDGDKVFAKPVVNLSHPKGQQTVDEIESGFLNAASVGHIVALEISTNPKDYLPGQKGPTISKWFNREASLVDIPGNYNALTDLVDSNSQPINLADFKNQISNMEKLFFTPAQLTLLNLKADANPAQVETAIADLIATAGKVPQLQTQVTNLTTEKDKAVNDLAAFKKSNTEKTIKDLCATALNDKRITKAGADLLEKDYEGKPDELKKYLDTLPKYKSITGNLKSEDAEGADEDLKKMSWDQLDKAGKLEDLKAADFELFRAKYKSEFKKDYPEEKK